MYEELLIGKKSLKTQHPLIFKADEKCLDPEYLFQRLEKLEENINEYDVVMSSKILKELVPEWVCSKSINNLKKEIWINGLLIYLWKSWTLPAGFEPAAHCLEGSCSIQLS